MKKCHVRGKSTPLSSITSTIPVENGEEKTYEKCCFFWKFDKNISLHLYDHAFQHPARPSIRRLALKLTPLPVAITVSYERLDERISENDPTLRSI